MRQLQKQIRRIEKTTQEAIVTKAGKHEDNRKKGKIKRVNWQFLCRIFLPILRLE